MRKKENTRSASDERSTELEPKKRRGCLATLFLTCLLLATLAFAGGSIWFALYVQKLSATLPSTEEILQRRPNVASVVFDRNGKIITRLYQENRTLVTIDKISPIMQKATVAAEDGSFYDHRGIDFLGILRAFWVNFTQERVRQGGSTITQQLARNLFLTQERTVERKIKEAILAVRLERLFTKDQLLEMYMNTIYFGHGAWGISAAARVYFAKTPQQLNLGEASMLAGLIAAPEYYSPLRNMERARTRQAYVLRRLHELGWIAEEDIAKGKNTEFHFASLKQPGIEASPAPYFVSYILFKHLLPQYGSDRVYQGGLRIYTTVDLELQHMAEEAVRKLKSEGALVALDPNTGEILALVGGKDFVQSKFNRAIQAFRQPGSAFKPFVYTAALEEGIRPVDRIVDAPISFDNGWEPGNYDGKFHGELTLMEALVHSYNTAVVRVAEFVGPSKIADLARRMGITSPHLPLDLSLALGTASVTPLELAASYAPFSNGGFRLTPYAIREIRGSAGELLESSGASLAPALTPEVALTMRSVMEYVVRSGTGGPARVKDYPVFGKTGTTNDFSDAWFVGGVPGLIVAVYAGNDDHKTLGKQATGGRIAGPVWQDFVSKAVAFLDLPKTYPLVESVQADKVRLCKTTGFRATGNCPAYEIYLPLDMIPAALCPLHGGDLTEAENDPLAPRLLIVERDRPLLAQYGLQRPQEVAVQELPVPSFIPVLPPNVPLPQPAANPYDKDPSPKDQVEARYQELLKEYGLGGN
jgi:1A family penicillin-binding protein